MECFSHHWNAEWENDEANQYARENLIVIVFIEEQFNEETIGNAFDEQLCSVN